MKNIALSMVVIAVPAPALAFDFGFVRAPDWMDPYIGTAFLTTLLLMGLTMLVKPKGVPFNRMYFYRRHFSGVGRFIYGLFGLSFVALMGMVFLGMGLQRAAEAGAF